MIQIDMEKPSACRWTDEENNIHLCPFLDREDECLLQGHMGHWAWDVQYKNCPLHEVIADPDTISRQQAIDALVSDYAYAAAKIIKALPPAPTPSRPKICKGCIFLDKCEQILHDFCPHEATLKAEYEGSAV